MAGLAGGWSVSLGPSCGMAGPSSSGLGARRGSQTWPARSTSWSITSPMGRAADAQNPSRERQQTATIRPEVLTAQRWRKMAEDPRTRGSECSPGFEPARIRAEPTNRPHSHNNLQEDKMSDTSTGRAGDAQNTERFQGWAVLELMGHRRLGGYLREVSIAGAGMLRIDIPRKDGSTFTQFYPPSTLYCLTPVSERVARAAAYASAPEPVERYEVRSLAEPVEVEETECPACHEVVDLGERCACDRADAAQEAAVDAAIEAQAEEEQYEPPF